AAAEAERSIRVLDPAPVLQPQLRRAADRRARAGRADAPLPERHARAGRGVHRATGAASVLRAAARGAARTIFRRVLDALEERAFPPGQGTARAEPQWDGRF